MCLYGSCSWINENGQTLYLPLPFYESLPFCVWHRHSLWQHPLIRNLIWKPYCDQGAFGMPLITNEWTCLSLRGSDLDGHMRGGDAYTRCLRAAAGSTCTAVL